jgi:hypothetical protein
MSWPFIAKQIFPVALNPYGFKATGNEMKIDNSSFEKLE